MVTHARDPSVPDPPNLIDCGDWACAHCNCEGLADVAGRLAACCCGAEQAGLEAVERLAKVDMLEASTRWMQVTATLRRTPANPRQ